MIDTTSAERTEEIIQHVMEYTDTDRFYPVPQGHQSRYIAEDTTMTPKIKPEQLLDKPS